MISNDTLVHLLYFAFGIIFCLLVQEVLDTWKERRRIRRVLKEIAEPTIEEEDEVLDDDLTADLPPVLPYNKEDR